MSRSSSSSRASLARHKHLAAAVAAVTLLAGAGGVVVGTATAGSGGAASALPASVATRASATGGHPHAARRHLPGALARMFALGRRAIELQAVVPSKGSYVTFSLVRGVVSAVSATDLSITEPDHTTVREAVTATTRVLPAALGGIAGVHDGDHVAVVARDGQATLVWLPGARAHAVRGVVQAVSPDSLVITTADGRIVHLSVSAHTRVLPTSAGGLAGVHDGARVVVRERAGHAAVIRLITPRTSPAPGADSAARPAPAEHTA